jgi:hypothetical protein
MCARRVHREIKENPETTNVSRAELKVPLCGYSVRLTDRVLAHAL